MIEDLDYYYRDVSEFGLGLSKHNIFSTIELDLFDN